MPLPATLSDELGARGNVVELLLAGKRLLRCEDYTVDARVFTQPAAFSLRIGQGSTSTAADIKRDNPQGTPFELRIADRPQYVGALDGYVGGQHGDGPTQMQMRGRDFLAPLHLYDADHEKDFANYTTPQLTAEALNASGLDDFIVVYDNSAARAIRSGVKSTSAFTEPVIDKKTAKQLAHAHVDESWWNFLKRHYDHAGVFMWSSPDRTIVVTRPNPKQKPIYRIIRRGLRNMVNASGSSFRDEMTHRYAEVHIYGRGGGKAKGRGSKHGMAVDPQLKALGFKSIKTFRDVNVANDDEARIMAIRKVAEYGRNGFELTYEVPGHVTDLIGGGRGVWTPDTMVEVDDEAWGYKGNFYLEGCTYRSPPTTTTLTLYRPEHLIFGLDGAS